MNIKKITCGPVQTNCYIIQIDGKFFVIDPSFDDESGLEKVLNTLDGNNLSAILLTHGHFDHIAGVDALVEIAGCPVYIHTLDYDFLSNPMLNGSHMMGSEIIVRSPATEITEGKLTIDDIVFDVERVAGHTIGSVAFIHDGHCFDGDFIFDRSIGRTDLATGDMSVMRESLRHFIKFHDKKLKLYPGHGGITDLEHQLLLNPYLQPSEL